MRCFSTVRELFGVDALEVDLPESATVGDLEAEMTLRRPDFARLPLARAVNRGYATKATVLREGDEVAFIPPISGGSTPPSPARALFQREPIDPRPLEALVRSDRDGAVVTFLGVTRNHHEGASVVLLRYEAYVEMAIPMLERILDEVGRRHAISRAVVRHRLGEVPIGEASIVVVVAAEHRAPAFLAAAEIMDRIKAEVPIFKQEDLAGPGGGSRWVGELPH
ncbi:MAG: molybdenum cofactor biosynthesis protein MoaE [Planctomycetota bacterium]